MSFGGPGNLNDLRYGLSDPFAALLVSVETALPAGNANRNSIHPERTIRP